MCPRMCLQTCGLTKYHLLVKLLFLNSGLELQYLNSSKRDIEGKKSVNGIVWRESKTHEHTHALKIWKLPASKQLSEWDNQRNSSTLIPARAAWNLVDDGLPYLILQQWFLKLVCQSTNNYHMTCIKNNKCMRQNPVLMEIVIHKCMSTSINVVTWFPITNANMIMYI